MHVPGRHALGTVLQVHGNRDLLLQLRSPRTPEDCLGPQCGPKFVWSKWLPACCICRPALEGASEVGEGTVLHGRATRDRGMRSKVRGCTFRPLLPCTNTHTQLAAFAAFQGGHAVGDQQQRWQSGGAAGSRGL
jgi:ribosomal protein L35AE/L33A